MSPLAARVSRLLAPILLAVAAYVAVFAADAGMTLLLSGRAVSDWLMDHRRTDDAVGFAQLAALLLSSAGAATAVTRALLRWVEARPAGLAVHARHCALLYLLLGAVAYGYHDCAGNCEGLMYGLLNHYGLLALGGIAANLAAIRRAEHRRARGLTSV